jgi:SAM-dependent methyltransferase
MYVNSSTYHGKTSCFGGLRENYVAARTGRPPELIKKLSEYIGSGPVFDAGTGTGISAREVADFNPTVQIVGGDHDPKMLEAAITEEDKRVLGRNKIEYKLVKVGAHPLNEKGVADLGKKFSLVTAMSCFHWFNKDLALQQFSSILAPKGHVAVVSGGGDQVHRKILEKVVGYAIDHPEMGEQKEELFLRNGFTVVFKGTFRTCEQVDVERFVKRIKSTSYWTDVQNSHKEAEAEKALRVFFASQANSKGIMTREKEVFLTIAQKVRKTCFAL